MKAEIISVGTELLLGQIVNTNAQFLAKELAKLGIDVYFQTVVGDNNLRIQQVIEIARSRVELLIFTGGLGPTEDDLTKEAVAQSVRCKIGFHESTIQKMRNLFAQNGDSFLESNLKQAMLIEGATPLPNSVGFALGNALVAEGICYLLLPGPPQEMQAMFINEGCPWMRIHLKEHLSSVLHSVYLKFAGIEEPVLEERLLDLIHNQQDPTMASYVSEGEITLRITTSAPNDQEAKRKLEPVLAMIRRRTQMFLYSEENLSLEAVVVSRLISLQRWLSLAESCTGGVLSHLITSIPGSGAVFKGGIIAYHKEIKRKQLGVLQGILEGPCSRGAVSAEAAIAMAEGVMTRMGTHYALSTTGNAGPTAEENKPVGQVFIALAQKGKTSQVKKIQFFGERQEIRVCAAKQALFMLWQTLISS